MNRQQQNPSISNMYFGILRLPVILAGLLLIAGMGVVQGQSRLPRCQDRPTWIDPPWIRGQDWCLEQVIYDPDAGTLGFAALAAAPDGRLYATRPLTGEVLVLTDEDGDGLPETPRVVAEGLTLPNGLTFYDGALYIAGGPNIYRLVEDEVEVLVDDIPWGAGFWTGGLTVGPDEYIYVAVGAACDFCEMDDPNRGAIWRYRLDGSDGQQVAEGLRQPGDVAFRDGVLWTLDTARDGLTEADMDELNRVEVGAHFGWPYCVGRDNQRDLAGVFDCATAAAPALSFPTHSTPIGIAVYIHDTFPDIQNSLLVVLHGNHNQAMLEGYAVAVVMFDEADNPTGYRVIIPEQTDIRYPAGLTLQDLQYQGSGFWPQRPIDVTVSREGWIYVSVSGGRILVLRPL